jgi:hypothetical protein
MEVMGYAYDHQTAMIWAEKVGYVVAILLITWILAKAAKWAFAKLVDRISFFRRATNSGESIGMTLGRVVSLLVWLFGLVAILNFLELGSVTGPVESMLTNVLEFVPNLLGAGIIFFVGLMIAKIVKELVETAMMAVNLDKWANKGGIDQVTGNATISKTIGTVVFVMIIIPVAVAALQALKISSISDPLVNMLNTMLFAVPNVIGAALILGLGYLIGRWVSNMASEILPGLGIDRAVSAMDIFPRGISISSAIANIAMIAVLLVSAVAATQLLQFPALTALVNEILALGSKIVFGGVIIAAGVLIANLLSKLVSGAAGEGSGALIVRYATIILFSAMGLSFMGVAKDIINLAFGALVVGGAAAAALAFGLGGRDAAARVLADMRSSSKVPAPAAKRTVKPAAKPITKPAARKPAAKK